MNTKALIISAVFLAAAFGAAAQCRVVAHRGYWKAEGSAQNSIRSIVKADSIGAYGSEFDVWLNVDNCLVINHDASRQGVNIEQSRQAQLDTLVLSNGEKMPCLDDYLSAAARLPRLRLILELKPMQDKRKEQRAAVMIADMLDKYKVQDRTDLISFSFEACRDLHRAMPDAKVMYLGGDKTPEEVKAAGLSGIDYSARCLRAHPDWIEQAHSLGLEVNVWTVNKPEDMRCFISRGVDYLTTDEPETALSVTAEK